MVAKNPAHRFDVTLYGVADYNDVLGAILFTLFRRPTSSEAPIELVKVRISCWRAGGRTPGTGWQFARTEANNEG